MTQPWFTLRRLAMALPAIFALHVAEEAPTFVAWFNAHVEPDITGRAFWAVTTAGLVITLGVAGIAATSREHALPWPAVAGVALLGGVPMFIHGWRIVFEGGRLL